MEIGFTGTQQGMTREQKVAIASLLEALDAHHVHHGDCVGADAEFHELAWDRGARVELHPPLNSAKRAGCDAHIKWPEHEYLKRNHHIVDCVETLIAAPRGTTEELRSGTWATIRYARKKGKRIFIVLRNGSWIEENAPTT